MINVKVGSGKAKKRKKAKPKAKKTKPTPINQALTKSAKESAKRAAKQESILKRVRKLGVKRTSSSVLGVGTKTRKPTRSAISRAGTRAIKGGSAAIARFIAARYGAKAIAKYQDYAGRLRRSRRLIKQIVEIDANTFRIRRHIIKTDTAGNNPYSCTCADFSQFSDDARNWLGSKAGPFNPCKHMMAVRDRRRGKWVCSGGVCTLDPNATEGYATKAICEAAVIPPLFLGGQCNTNYALILGWDLQRISDNLIVGGASVVYNCISGGPGGIVKGPIGNPYVILEAGIYYVRFECRDPSNNPVTYTAGSGGFSFRPVNLRCENVSGKPDRCDGLPDDCGDLAGSCPI